MKKNLNQKLINLVEYYNLINANLLLSDTPLKRNLNKTIITTIDRTLLASESGATVIINHAARVITLPTAAAGLHFKIVLGIEATAGCNILTAANTQCFFGHIPLASSGTDDQTGQAQIATTFATTTGEPESYDAMKFVAATATIGGVAGTVIDVLPELD